MANLGVIAIIYDIAKDGKYHFLILHRSFVWNGWEFLKGKQLDNETTEEAVLKKVRLSTQLNKLSIEKKLTHKRQFLHKGRLYVYEVFVIKGDMNEEIDISEEVTEHDRYAWTLFPEVIDKLYWDAEKRDVINFMKCADSLCPKK